MTLDRSGLAVALVAGILVAVSSMSRLEPARAAVPKSLDEVLAAHCRAREQLVPLRARFEQTKVFELFDDTDSSAGVLYYRRPDAARWQYTEPDSSYTVLRGDSGWAVFPDIRQVQKFALHGTRTANVLAIVGFGACGGDFRASFDITLGPAQDGKPVLVLVPKTAEMASSFDRIELVLDHKLFLPRSVILHETSGNTTRFEFLELQPGVSIDTALFDYVIPKGYEVVG